jgi:hypothetical protein
VALPQKVALVPLDDVDINVSELTRVAAALSKQVNRDFRPLWGVDATVDAFAKLEDVEIDYWPMIIVQDVPGAAGVHLDRDGQPFALIEHSGQWSLTASHECLEMLADPFGNRLVASDLLDQAVALGQEPHRVRYLVEVCDPPEAGQFAYTVNGVLVSDFYTPHFFDPVQSSGVRYSFTGAIDGPRKVLDGGYISWEDPTDGHWRQIRMFPDDISSKVPHLVDLTADTALEEVLAEQTIRAIRPAIDRVTKTPAFQETLPGAALTAARSAAEGQERVSRAEYLREQIAELPTTP